MNADNSLTRPVTRLGIWGWVMFDWACQPFFTLVTTFIYAPYFATAIVGDGAQGQALWGYAAGFAGFLVAVFSPILGAIADASGRRKPWIAAFGILFVAGSWLLWEGRPGEADTIIIALTAFALASIGVEFATVFNNSMMPTLVPPERLGRLSGLGWGMGYVGGLVSLVVTLAVLAGNPETGRTILGFEPWFGLDANQREGDRVTGPLTAIWFIVFVLPLFLFTPDGKKVMKFAPAVRVGLHNLAEMIREVRKHRNRMIFLLANMIYLNGLGALFAFGGIYAATMFGWGTIEVGLFAIFIVIASAIGALAGGPLDDKIGSKTVILGALAILLAMTVSILLVDRESAFFFPVAPKAADAGLFGSLPEKLYFFFGAMLGVAAGPLQASSRTLLARIAPREQIGQFYGLFALSGKLTAFIGPLVVAAVTTLTASQRAGFSSLIVFFSVGALLLAMVKVSAGNGARR
jgi:MFS transporter, UMF1 family